MNLYKLTNAAGKTYGGTQWGENVTNYAVGPREGGLCSSALIHAYATPPLAELCDCIHGCFGESGILWLAEGEVAESGGLKVGCRSLTTLRRMDRKPPTTEQRVAFGVLSAWTCGDETWRVWARGWLAGKDRTAESATAAEARAAAVWAAEATAAARATERSAEKTDFAAIAEIAMQGQEAWLKYIEENPLPGKEGGA